jgi:hypothetical protein
MSLEKFDNVAKGHPELHAEFQALRQILDSTSATASLEPATLAAITNLPVARLETVLEYLAEATVLRLRRRWHCEVCHQDSWDSIDSPIAASPDSYHYLYQPSPILPKEVSPESTGQLPDDFFRDPPPVALNTFSPSDRRVLRKLLSTLYQTPSDWSTFVAGSQLNDRLRNNLRLDTLDGCIHSILDRLQALRKTGLFLEELSEEFDRQDIAALAPYIRETYGESLADAVVPSKPWPALVVDTSRLQELTSILPFMGIERLEKWAANTKRLICKVRCGTEEKGTGFLIGERWVLTCHHVVATYLDSTKRGQIAVQFDYFAKEDGAIQPTPWLPCDPQWEIPYSPHGQADLLEKAGVPKTDELDFAILQLPSTPSGQRGALPLFELHPIPTVPGALILLAGHPGPHQLQPIQCSIAAPGFVSLNENQTRFAYRNSTQKGSSGSPIFDHHFRWIGMHHNRGALRQNQPSMVEDNRGIPGKAIVAWLRRHSKNNPAAKAACLALGLPFDESSMS